MPHILEHASRREEAENRGMISALVVKKDQGGRLGEPYPGFHRLARQAPFNRPRGDDLGMWLQEVRHVIDANRDAGDEPQHGRLVTLENLGAWMFTCNPGSFDFATFLDWGGSTIDSWSVKPTYRTSEVLAAGQRALLWVFGNDNDDPTPGVWGDGVILGPAYHDDSPDESGLWIDEKRSSPSPYGVPVDIRLLSRPITRKTLKADPRLARMEVLRQPQMANPLFVTADELAALEEYLPPPRDVTVTASGAGFGSPANRAAVEQAAMDAVRSHYEDGGWTADDVSAQCLGWDLTCTSPTGTVHLVEVKGVSGAKPTILLTSNEARAAKQEPDWRLAVVTTALSTPTLRIVDGPTAMGASRPFLHQVDLSKAD
ncbi:protein NO VEIN domain-containing protein [Catellatospora bangladeshensis]|uniref:Protein NO VEIN C-terminal domain-containing protein n=2 Tax=Catellatospora bangladeshensis TaxID=310355 RepID=A0A8J3NPF9_9ACTN|nr:hypothetical protein Cba03nite_72440 [Catellatospora bangladeshensis]